MALGNCYLEFLQMCSLISLVLDNHVDNNLKEILLFVYYGLIVNSRPKKGYPHVFLFLAQKHTLWVLITSASSALILVEKAPYLELLSIYLLSHITKTCLYSNILKILHQKNKNFQIKISDIIHISAQNIDCGYW